MAQKETNKEKKLDLKLISELHGFENPVELLDALVEATARTAGNLSEFTREELGETIAGQIVRMEAVNDQGTTVKMTVDVTMGEEKL